MLKIGRWRAVCFKRDMASAFTFFLFAFDRVRTVLLALSAIVLVKLTWLLMTGGALG